VEESFPNKWGQINRDSALVFSFLIFLDKIFPALNNHADIIRTDFSEESGKCGEGKERARINSFEEAK
jgi:hypothetical protein